MSSPHQPWQSPAPPPAGPQKRPVFKIVLWSTLATVIFCFGGLLTIGIIAGPPDKPAATTADRAAQQPLLAAPTTTPAAAEPTPAPVQTTTQPAAPTAATSTATQPRTTSRAARPAPTTTRPKPRATSKKPRPAPTYAEPEPEPEPEPDTVYYKNCSAVRAAGADPIRSGDPGYGRHLDRDGDGVACE